MSCWCCLCVYKLRGGRQTSSLCICLKFQREERFENIWMRSYRS
ncbi:hypothetical protein Hanom_Chr06g00539441 [Helianthus anomalus]